MIRHLAATLAAAVLTVGCESRTPTAPSTNPQPQPVSIAPAQPTGSGPRLQVSGSPIVVGSLTRGTVESGDPVCYPHWDSTGHCRQFDLKASSDSSLRVTLKWEGPSLGLYAPELFLVPPDGGWVYSNDPWPETRLIFEARAAQTYRIVVIGYRLPQAFEVLVEVQ